ncbi:MULTISPECIES: DUF1674 domain-containing protein [Thalassospira]|uniref:Dihydrodipicolinate reductase n=2 Tax=Thalassospira tepidiphila TaxID=393657 RepID=A0A853L261_9PROT|nr:MULTISPECIES: succinate dehydrogenase assembly factor 4 [Thalassospira]MBO6579828.1 DUF1674 domain-containing protein [Thalassospira sp.]MBO6803734.1 DUF1674 domain-containing protein [Thalassospira sp.]MBO6817714.1 DUF1674 domain-containing protein [Thalassospira sp.]MBO6888374.1 DUF1674 domain-containing protein [Thalassospira sp.]NJB73442.1 hypothetical protein [Thalassospira tepidiphila]
MAGKFRETVIHEVPKEKAEPQADTNPAPDEIAGAEAAPQLSQDAINALAEAKAAKEAAAKAREIGGPKGPEPTRFGDWENKGRCIDF